MYRIYYFILLIITGFFSTLFISNDLKGQNSKDGLMIGWASTDITPLEPALIAGGSSARVFDEVNDPVTATVLVMESVQNGKADDYVVMIAVDLVAAGDYLKGLIIEKVQKKYPQLDPDRFIMNASH